MISTAATLSHRFAHRYAGFAALVDKLQPIFALALRLYVARVFLTSGLIKLQNWPSTLGLFENEFHVPVLSASSAAVIGTGAEILLPGLLALGLGTRLSAFALFVFNIIAVISYPDLSDAGLKDHILWGALLLVTLIYGPGKIAVDRLFERRSTP
ncbi:MAG: DoxX family protein [Betaproteobacteria bacterium]